MNGSTLPLVIGLLVSASAVGSSPSATRHHSSPPRAAQRVTRPAPRVVTVEATAYCLRGRTATGTTPRRGVVAVDPRVIPLGSRVYVEGYGWASGRCVVAVAQRLLCLGAAHGARPGAWKDTDTMRRHSTRTPIPGVTMIPTVSTDLTRGHRRAMARRFGASRLRSVDPATRSYWVVPGQVMAGCYPGDLDATWAQWKVSRLLAEGVDTFIDLTEPDEIGLHGTRLTGYAATVHTVSPSALCYTCPIPDHGIPAPPTMAWVLDVIDASIAEGGVVYVHCRGGYGRTGTVVGCWLRRHGIATSGEDAVRIIRWLRDEDPTACVASPETHGQARLVSVWTPGR